MERKRKICSPVLPLIQIERCGRESLERVGWALSWLKRVADEVMRQDLCAVRPE